MKWDNTQRLIDSSFELTMLAIKYCGNLCIVNNKGEETPLDRKRPKQLDKNDVKFAYDLCMSLNTDSVVNEIESHLTGDYDNNKLIFKVFFGKNCYCVFISGGRKRKSFLKGEVQQGSCSWNRLDLANTGL